jgi:hypothetical protein
MLSLRDRLAGVSIGVSAIGAQRYAGAVRALVPAYRFVSNPARAGQLNNETEAVTTSASVSIIAN